MPNHPTEKEATSGKEDTDNDDGRDAHTVENMFHAAAVDARDYQLRKHLESGLDPDTQNEAGETVLHVAVRGWNEPGTKMILEDFNGNVNSVTKEGDTPMHYAGRFGAYYEGGVASKINDPMLDFDLGVYCVHQ